MLNFLNLYWCISILVHCKSTTFINAVKKKVIFFENNLLLTDYQNKKDAIHRHAKATHAANSVIITLLFITKITQWRAPDPSRFRRACYP